MENRKYHHIGYYDSAAEGAEAYDKYFIDNNLKHNLNLPMNIEKPLLGRPPKPIDWDEINKLLSFQCTGEEAAAYIEVDYETLDRAIKREKSMDFGLCRDKACRWSSLTKKKTTQSGGIR